MHVLNLFISCCSSSVVVEKLTMTGKETYTLTVPLQVQRLVVYHFHVVMRSVIYRCTCIYTELTWCCYEVSHTQVYMHLYRAYLVLSWGQSYTGVHAFIQSLPCVVMTSVIHRCTCIYTELTSCCHDISHTQVYMHLYRAYHSHMEYLSSLSLL